MLILVGERLCAQQTRHAIIDVIGLHDGLYTKNGYNLLSFTRGKMKDCDRAEYSWLDQGPPRRQW